MDRAREIAEGLTAERLAEIQRELAPVERMAKALFLAEHPNARWSAGRARAIWFLRAEAALECSRTITKEQVEACAKVLGDDFMSAADRAHGYPKEAALAAARAFGLTVEG